MRIIEFLGMSRAGKTTHINQLEMHLKEENKNIFVQKRPEIHFNNYLSLELFHRDIFNVLKSTYEYCDTGNFDYLLYDRGFYDRLAILNMDYCDKRIKYDFKQKMEEEIKEYLSKIDVACMLLIDPVASLDRLGFQKMNGMDSSKNNKLLDLRDKCVDGLKKTFDDYMVFSKNYKNIIKIYTYEEQEKVHKKIIDSIA